MRRFLPRHLFPTSLFGQTLLLLLAGLIVSHAIGSFIYSLDRESAVRAVGGLATAQRIANVSRLVEDMPADWRDRLVAGLSDRSLTVVLAETPPLTTSDAGPVADVIRDYLIRQLRLSRRPRTDGVGRHDRGSAIWPAFRALRWRVRRRARQGFRHGPRPHDARAGRRDDRRGRARERERRPMMRALGLEVAVPLADGQWLFFATNLPSSNTGFSYQYLISMLVMAAFIIAISIWAVRRMTAPLATVAQAADRLGRDVNAPPLPESGTVEMKQAAQAFNAMQTKLPALIENRTRMLAALSHDLRTPLTLLRLRTENVDNVDERDKMLATIADMDAMIGATLQYAREQAADEPRRATDVSALVQSVTDDMADAGLDVAMTPVLAGLDRLPAGRAQARPHQPDRECGQIRPARAGVADGVAPRGRDRGGRRRSRHSGGPTRQGVRAILPGRGFAQPRHRRRRPRACDRQHRGRSAGRHAIVEQPAAAGPSRIDHAAPRS